MGIFSKISNIFTGKHELDVANAETLTDALITADIAPDIAENLVAKLRARAAVDTATAKQILYDAMLPLVRGLSHPACGGGDAVIASGGGDTTPAIILVIGVNGAGKTTTIGKLARQWTDDGKSVVIGAADTFRAAATEQLSVWAARAGATLITGTGDPASVAYRAAEYGKQNNADIVVIDTAGRLHNRTDLMDELAKMTRVIKKVDADAPHDTWLVLDANTGKNATSQIEFFNRVAPLSGLIVTKMDSTARGGFLVSYAAKNKSPLPVVAIGYGEKIDDLRPFSAPEYLKKLLDM